MRQKGSKGSEWRVQGKQIIQRGVEQKGLYP